MTEQITTLRKQLKLNQGIEARSVQIQKGQICYFANEYRAKKHAAAKESTEKGARRTMTTDNEIYTQLDRITDHLATMTKQERIAWFRRSTYVQPLNFIREIDGTVYAVRAFFKEDARENITDKVQRIVLNDTENRKQI